MKSRVLVVLFLLAGSAAAQFDRGSSGHVHVRFTFANGVCYPFTHVQLIGANGLLGERMPDDQCEVDFASVPAGTYHVKASGQNLSDTDSLIATAAWSADLLVHVRPPAEPERGIKAPVDSLVSAADLAVPAKAKKDFVKATELASREDFAKAIQALHHAIAIYPAFAGAYNNLGVLYQRLGDPVQERDSLQKAIDIDDHYVLAFLNLGRMRIRAQDFAGAEVPLRRAAALAPNDPMPLLLLAFSQLMERRFDEAVATSRRAHSLGISHALVHRIAARALEQQGQTTSAAAELESFLSEEPSGSRSGEARKELDMVRRGIAVAEGLDITDLLL